MIYLEYFGWFCVGFVVIYALFFSFWQYDKKPTAYGTKMVERRILPDRRDRTGLGTVRDLAKVIIEGGEPYFSELFFMLDGKKVNIEAVVTYVDGKPFGAQCVRRFNGSVSNEVPGVGPILRIYENDGFIYAVRSDGMAPITYRTKIADGWERVGIGGI